MAELIDVFKAMMRKGSWEKITVEEKEKNLFIKEKNFSKMVKSSVQPQLSVV